MAIIKCPECTKEVSDKANVCPNCGFGVADYVDKQTKILKIQRESETEAYLYVKQIQRKEIEIAKQAKKAEEDRKNNTYNIAVNKYLRESSKDVEEAEKLFLSILEWKDSDEYYKKCKSRIIELKQQELIQEEKESKQRRKRAIILTVSLLSLGLIIGIFSFYNMVLSPKFTYESAINNIESGNYDVAILELETIIKYKDSSEQITKSKYLNAKKLIDERQFTQALKLLKEIQDIKEVNALIEKCESGLAYEEAIAKMELEEYEEAIKLLEYSNLDISDEKTKECYLQLAYQEMEKKEYGNAINFF